jgi:hypothetical protein
MLCDLQIARDAKTQVWRNVSQRISCGTRTGPNRAGKIVCKHSAPLTQKYVLDHLLTAQNAKTQVHHNMSYRASCGTGSGPP